MLAINAMIFRIPHILWKFFEGGVMKNFHSGKGLKSDLMNNDGDMEEHMQTHIAYFKKLSKKNGKNLSYYAKFQGCQILNIIMLVVNFCATDGFLSGNFGYYGSQVVSFLTRNSETDKGWDGTSWPTSNPGPMCHTFPTVVRINISCKTFLNVHIGA